MFGESCKLHKALFLAILLCSWQKAFAGDGVEIGFGAGASFILGEREVAPAFHLHSTRKLTSIFHIGASAEFIADEHAHINFSAVLSMSFEHLRFAFLPGVTLFESKVFPALHGEVTYTFEIFDFVHVGPLLAVGYEFGIDNVHLTVGLHTGFEF